MKQTIKYKAPYDLVQIKKGDWIDLKTSELYIAKQGEYKNIELGIAMQLPAGFEAIVAPRSSTFKNHHIIMVNSIGVIDNLYRGNDDTWKFAALAIEPTYIATNERICQFRIQLSQKATVLQKIKWLFTNKIEFVKVDYLGDNNRGGFGSTGRR